jgi:hypothetical protein
VREAADVTADDARRAHAAFAFEPGTGPAVRGEGEAVIDDDTLTVSGVRVAWLDADAATAADYRITISLWPAGQLTLSMLGRRFDAFAAALAEARDLARVAGLLAHAPTPPETFPGAVRGTGAPRHARLLIYPTHLTVVPEGEDPFQVPHGALTGLEVPDDPPGVTLVTEEGRTVLGQLARQRDAFHTAVRTAHDAQAKLLAGYAGQPLFADGIGVPRDAIHGFDALLERCTAPERLAGARTLLAAAQGGEPRLGFAHLLDPDAESLQAPSALPEDWASFLLVTVGRLVVFELLAGPGAATYLFEGAVADVNRDLQLLHLRRSGLALTAEQAAITPENPHRLALRRLAPLQRLRKATRARLVHAEHWADALAKAVAGG